MPDDRDAEIVRLRDLLDGAAQERDKWFGLACDEQVSNQWRERQITEAREEIVLLRSKIEDLESDAANDAGCYEAMREAERQVYEIIGIERGHDNWPEFCERLRAHISALRASPTARVVEAARNLYNAYDGIKSIRDSGSIPIWERLRESIAEFDAALPAAEEGEWLRNDPADTENAFESAKECDV